MFAMHEDSFVALNLKRCIGTGSTAQIFLAGGADKTKDVAIKIFSPEIKLETASKEADILRSLSHPNIIAMKDFYTLTCSQLESKQALLVMEYASQGDLLDLVQIIGPFPSGIAFFYFHQTLDALEYLHQTANVSHGDIKPENICIDEHFNAKLADFGHAKKVDKAQLISDARGNSSYLSPEMHQNKPFNTYQSDLFALGVTLFIMMSGTFPFESATADDELYQYFIKGDLEEFWHIHEEIRVENFGYSCAQNFYREEFRELINCMLAYNPNERYDSFADIRRAVWCQKTLLRRCTKFNGTNYSKKNFKS